MTTTSVEMVNPQIFRVGDLVEAQVSFIGVPLKNNKYKMMVVLQSIALLNATFSQVRSCYPCSVALTYKNIGSAET